MNTGVRKNWQRRNRPERKRCKVREEVSRDLIGYRNEQAVERT